MSSLRVKCHIGYPVVVSFSRHNELSLRHRPYFPSHIVTCSRNKRFSLMNFDSTDSLEMSFECLNSHNLLSEDSLYLLSFIWIFNYLRNNRVLRVFLLFSINTLVFLLLRNIFSIEQFLLYLIFSDFQRFIFGL